MTGSGSHATTHEVLAGVDLSGTRVLVTGRWGRYCEDGHVADVAAAGTAGVCPYAIDPERAQALWASSQGWVGERF